MRSPNPLVLAVALLAGSAARADTVEVDSTTLLNVAKQTRGPGPDPELVTVAPAFEILSITARDLQNPLADDLTIAISTWGSWDMGERRWDAATRGDLTGDVVTGYVQGKLVDRRLTLRLGRAQVQTSVARMVHLDGGQVIGALPLGLRLSAYAGAPVAERFATRTGYRSWNPLGGDLAYGGRLGWSLSLPGVPGRGLDIGASANFVSDGGDPVKEELGADLRLKLAAPLTLSAFGAYSIYDERLSEATVRAGWNVTRKVLLEADYSFIAPDLFLSRNSILSVFSVEERQQFGGGASWQVGRGLRVGANYHLRLEPDERGKSSEELGHEADVGVQWQRGPTLLGADAFVLDSFDNGYVGGRVFGRRQLGRAFAALDLLLHSFREDINGESTSLSGTLSAGIDIARGLSAVVAGRAGVTPFLEESFEVLAKLVYAQTYRKSEVR
jgi:hypothetical protein